MSPHFIFALRIKRSARRMSGTPCVARAARLVVHDGHVEVADLLQRVGQVGVALRQSRVQQDAAVVEGDALSKSTFAGRFSWACSS